jgi:hypothetical protein
VSDERRRAITTPGERADPARRGPASAFVSVVVHIVAIAILIRIAVVPLNWLGGSRAEEPQATHVNFMEPAADTGSHRRAGGDNRAVKNNAPTAPLVSPSAIPSMLPPVPESPKVPAAAAPSDNGTGAMVGGGGPTRGVVPAYADPRIWSPSDPVPGRPKTATEKLDSAISARVQHLDDSLKALGYTRADGDWSWKGKDGKKYGIDQKYIHLGNFSIPTALLALLPLNVQGNPTTYENAHRIGTMRAEILQQEARATRDGEFNAAVRELRERKQKERADKAKEDATIPDAPPPPRIQP